MYRALLASLLLISALASAQIQFTANEHADGWRYTADPAAELPLANLSSVRTMGIGGNVSRLEQWDTAWPFADLMKASYGWREVSGTGAYAIDIHDRVTSLTGDRVLGKYLATDVQDPTLPAAGEYTVRKAGTGEYNIASTGWTSAATSTFTIAQGAFLDIQVRGGTIDSLVVARSSDLATIDSGNPWRPEYLAYMQALNLSTVRQLNAFDTNYNLNENWSDRTIVDALSYTGSRYRSGSLGVGDNIGSRRLTIPVEHMIDLSNRLKANIWITVPTRFNDAAITSLATLLRDNLDSRLKIKVEYSNETWNFSSAFFSQMLWAATNNISRYTLTGTAGSTSVTFTGYTPTENETIRVIHHNDAERRVAFGQPFFENTEITVTNISGNTGDLSSALPVGTEILYFYRTADANDATGDAIQNNQNVDFGTGQRSTQIFTIFDTVFGANSNRVKNVIASQAGLLSRTVDRISASGTNGSEDIVSVGGYFGIEYNYTAGNTVADVISYLRGGGITVSGPVYDATTLRAPAG